jgi:hypothetical protein
MASLNNIICKITGLEIKILLIILGFLLYLFHILSDNHSLIASIIITSFVLALYDVFLKNILLFSVTDEYYKLVINNVITIVVIDFLIRFIRNIYDPKINFLFYFNIAFSCIFYETIVFKLYNYNNLCNKRLRNTTKTIIRLTTIHILSNFLNGYEYDETWFNFSFGQIFNFALFDTIFSQN